MRRWSAARASSRTTCCTTHKPAIRARRLRRSKRALATRGMQMCAEPADQISPRAQTPPLRTASDRAEDTLRPRVSGGEMLPALRQENVLPEPREVAPECGERSPSAASFGGDGVGYVPRPRQRHWILEVLQYASNIEPEKLRAAHWAALACLGSPTWARTRDLRINRSSGTWPKSITWVRKRSAICAENRELQPGRFQNSGTVQGVLWFHSSARMTLIHSLILWATAPSRKACWGT
jgi:hypothetical protein